MAIPRISAPDRWQGDRFRTFGLWRGVTGLTDLRVAAQDFPHRLAVHALCGNEVVKVTYGELHRQVFRFAEALRALDVAPGDAVAYQLPNRWENAAMTLACAAVGAVAAPVMPSMGPRERARFQEWAGARVLVRTEDLPHFLDGDWAGVDTGEEDDPDRVFLVLFTSGTTGEPKGVLHSHNTLFACVAPFVAEEGFRCGGVVSATPHSLTRIAGLAFGLVVPLHVGGTAVYQDEWDPAGLHGLLAEAGAQIIACAPPFLAALLEQQRANPLPIPWRAVLAGGMPVPSSLVPAVREHYGVPLRALWAMTEGGFSWTRATDPEDFALRSDGRFGAALEHRLVGDGPERSLRIRGAALARAVLDTGTGQVRVLAEHHDGWYDTGDLARPDGHGGIRLAGRGADRIGGISMILVKEVEDELAAHPAVAEVALVGYPDPEHGELPCAVVVPRGEPPTLADLHEFLDGRGMTEWYQPARVQVVTTLPRNEMGKVRKNLLRAALAGGQPGDPAVQ